MTVFLSTPSARRATPSARIVLRRHWNFYPRPPRGGRRDQPAEPVPLHEISIHALREEGDQDSPPEALLCSYFYPRPPRGGRQTTEKARPRLANFYPRPPRGGRQGRADQARPEGSISIHALREEGDRTERHSGRRNADFYPRPPRGGRHRQGQQQRAGN